MHLVRLIVFVGGALVTGSMCLSAQALVDPDATAETLALFRSLQRLPADRILFGHQHATETGHGWAGDAERSDVKSVVGSHPAVIGVDFGRLSGFPPAEVAATQRELQKTIVATYDRGGIITASWHMMNPILPSTGFRWQNGVSVPTVHELLPGGAYHDAYQKTLQTAAEVAHGVHGVDGTLAPIIFRPFHECDGDWFWWGKAHTSGDDFIALWRFTVSYLRDVQQVHNFIYAFSPDVRFSSEAEYLERYPGDGFVDLVGCDDYADFGRDGKYDLAGAVTRLQIVSHYAVKSGKLAALTETGLESLTDRNWWTSVLLKTVQSHGLKLAYVLVWRNDTNSPTHFFAPFPGHPSVPDFVRFYRDPRTLFENDLPALRLYREH